MRHTTKRRKSPPRTRNIQTLVSINSFIPLLFTVLIFSLSFFIYTSSILMDRGRASLLQINSQITENLSAELRKMGTLAMNITYSGRLKTTLRDHLEIIEEPETPDRKVAQYLNTVEVTRIIGDITGPYKTVPQVNIIFPGQFSIGTGMYAMIQPIQEQTTRFLASYNTAAGAPLYSYPHWDALANRYLGSEESQQFISLFKTIFDDYRHPLGILEVKQYADTIFADLQRSDERVLVFDATGTQIYPATIPMGSIYTDFANRAYRGTIRTFNNPYSGSKEILAISEILENGWIVLTITDRNRYLRPVYQFLMGIILVSLIILGAGYSISIILSRKITIPLKDLSQKISHLDWIETSDDRPSPTPNTSLTEVKELHLSFQAMSKKLDTTLAHVVAEKTLETQSRLLALQAQMDPHFIYNMLTTLSIMAEEGETKEIVATIHHMTPMLRYIASGTNTLSTLSEELEIAEHYISCMRIRFGERLQFTKDIPEELHSLPIPRHVILPLVENAIKYGMTGNPPWCIDLSARFVTDPFEVRDELPRGKRHWIITVRDNGPGFDPEARDKLYEEIAQCRSDKTRQLDFHIHGMGLINLYSRLLIHYGDTMLFEVTPQQDGSGSEIRLGGVW